LRCRGDWHHAKLRPCACYWHCDLTAAFCTLSSHYAAPLLILNSETI
jgi:hypothetical protein